ncbi:hypothetical protein CDAR_585101 [Caerostris darwini]|uniref:Uncharacterized protein n=1 Tax=Caerostris darwini TaxID=1538125 RepID=A0AAV4T4K7_9ARAC|nr:hypothetical protein CDAR_585101 [Caerostris darwini]
MHLLQTKETCPPTNAQLVIGSPIYLIAGDCPPSTQSLSALFTNIHRFEIIPTINTKQTKQSISQMLSIPNRRDLSTHECATCERISHLPYCRRSSTIDTIIKCPGD